MTFAYFALLALLAAVQDDPAVTALPGFKVEAVYTVPKATEGSWVAMTFDPKGRLLVSPQQGKLLRVTLGPGGAKVEPLDVQVGDAQGLLCAFGSLYVTGNGPKGCGFYRLKEAGDGYGEAELLKAWPGGMGEHGPHAILRGPDQKLYCIVGNHVKPPAGLAATSPHKNWQEDLLLPRMWDPNGHAVGITAPGGYIVRTDRDGKEWEMFCAGFRNEYDAAFSADGELFTFDSDMEWDIGTPWYRPTRIYHCVTGGEFGWRSASGKWPVWYPDNLPMAADIGLGSPTGMVFGTGAKFPAKYQRALFALDWAYGKIFAVHLTPDGASHAGSFEPFVTGKPLNVADVEIGPDGAMYFVCGGRGTQSRLYRVTYAGSESTEPVAPGKPNELVELRRKLEAFHGKKDPQAVRIAWPHLNHSDRFVRFAARIAIEHQDVESWKYRALNETLPTASLEACLALARSADKALLPRIVEALNRLGAPWDKIGEDEKLSLYRAYQVAFARMGPPDAATAASVAEKLDKVFPTGREAENRELCQILLYLEHPAAVKKTLDLLARATSQQEQLHYGFHLRTAKAGWTMDLRKQYFAWFNDATQKLKGGHSFQGFIRNSRTEAMTLLTPQERSELDPIIRLAYLPPKSAAAAAPVVKAWAMEDLLPDLEAPLRGRNFNSGKAAFEKAQCFACHRFGQEGGSTGPDITAAASRFNRKDLLESILLPSKVISDQYNNTIYQKESGDVVVGRAVKDDGLKLTIKPNPIDEATVELAKKDIKASKPSPVSPMPEALVNILKKEEILDLLAYIESGGDKGHAVFKK